jgi:hypothetical protein
MDPEKQLLLGNGCVTSINEVTVGSGVFCAVPAEVMCNEGQLPVKYRRESHGTRIRKWMCWRGPAAIVNDTPIRTVTASVQLENKITGRESQGAYRWDELIGGISPVVK